MAKNLPFFCSYCKIFTHYISRKNVGKLTVIQKSTPAHNSVQFCCTPKHLLCGSCTLLEDKKSVPDHSHQNKRPNFLKTFVSASSASGTMLDILLQKSPELKTESRKSFTSRQKSSPVT